VVNAGAAVRELAIDLQTYNGSRSDA
jgi:hypothetical protein